jgi:hypothetical protein
VTIATNGAAAYAPIKVDKGIPIPEPAQGQRSRYPWAELKVGDSFFAPKSTTASAASFRSGIAKHAKQRGMKFTARLVEGGVRVWRVA